MGVVGVTYSSVLPCFSYFCVDFVCCGGTGEVMVENVTGTLQEPCPGRGEGGLECGNGQAFIS